LTPHTAAPSSAAAASSSLSQTLPASFLALASGNPLPTSTSSHSLSGALHSQRRSTSGRSSRRSSDSARNPSVASPANAASSAAAMSSSRRASGGTHSDSKPPLSRRSTG